MEAIRSSETSVNPSSTQRHIPEDNIVHSHRCESLKLYRSFVCFSIFHAQVELERGNPHFGKMANMHHSFSPLFVPAAIGTAQTYLIVLVICDKHKSYVNIIWFDNLTGH
jgi:hypothetical protein